MRPRRPQRCRGGAGGGRRRRRRTTTSPSRRGRSGRRPTPATQADGRAGPAAWPASASRSARKAAGSTAPNLPGHGQQPRQGRIGDIAPVRQVVDRVGVLVQLLGDPEGEQQVGVDVVHRGVGIEGSANCIIGEPADVRARDPGRRRLTTTAPTCSIDWTIDATSRRGDCGRARIAGSCSGLPSKSVTSIVVAGPQELPGVQVAVDPMRRPPGRRRAAAAARPRPAPRRATPTRRGNWLPGARLPIAWSATAAISTMEGCRSASAVCRRAVIAPMRRADSTRSARASVPSSHASTSSTYQSHPSSAPGRYEVTMA